MTNYTLRASCLKTGCFEKKTSVICLNSLNIRSENWRRSLFGVVVSGFIIYGSSH